MPKLMLDEVYIWPLPVAATDATSDGTRRAINLLSFLLPAHMHTGLK